MTPSATLPSSSTLTLVSAIDAPTTLARAFRAKRPKTPPRGGRRLPGPLQGVAQRCGVDRQRAFHHRTGAIGYRAVEGEFQRRTRQPRLQAGAVARERGEKVGDADCPVDTLAVPVELSGR